MEIWIKIKSREQSSEQIMTKMTSKHIRPQEEAWCKVWKVHKYDR